MKKALVKKFRGGIMKFKVDQELCIGCGACEGVCPEVFELDDDKSKLRLGKQSSPKRRGSQNS